MSDPVAVAALARLDQVISDLPMPAPPTGVSHRLRVMPAVVSAAGIGGYVGQHANPVGSIYARRVLATLDVRVDGGEVQMADDHLRQVICALLQQDQATLRSSGVERLTLRQADTTDPRAVRFDVRFGYQHLPTSPEGVIDTLDVGIDTNVTPYRGRYRLDVATHTLAGLPQPMAEFVAVDDTDLDVGSPAGNWRYDEAVRCIVQVSPAAGGSADFAQPRKAGTALLCRPGGAPLAVARFNAVIEFESASPAGVGIVFGRTGVNDRWHFLASQANGFHLFGRKSGDAWSLVGAPARVGFTVGQRHTLTLTVFDQTLRAALDGVQTLEVRAEQPVPAGEIGFFTHGNNGARFHRVRLLELV